MNAKEADLKFRENFGKDEITGIKFNYDEFIPETLKDALTNLKTLVDSDKPAVIDRKYVLDEIEDLLESYESIVKFVTPGTVSKDMSMLILGCSQIYDYEMCNFITPDTVRNSKEPMSSRFTKVVYDAITLKDDAVFEPLTSLINTIIEYFDPNVAAKVLSNCIIKHRDSVYFTQERIRGYFEALINRENVVYGSSKYIPLFESVGFVYYNTTYTSPLDVLTDKHNVYSLIAAGNNNVYGDVFKMFVTQDLLNEIFRENSGAEDDPCVLVLRHIKEDVVSWVKHKNLDERPECPESFKYIDMKLFMSKLYQTGIHIIGDAEEIIKKFDDEYEALDIAIYKGKYEGKDLENAKERRAALKKRRKDYLRLKSSISLLFVEILSNEKVAYMAFNEEMVAMIVLAEPPFNFGMNDVHSNVSATFIKRDFKPVQSQSINPYYVHFGEQELSSENAKYIASVISALVHPNMRSVAALAGSYNFENLENTVKSLKYHYATSLEIFGRYLDGVIKRITGLRSQYGTKKVTDPDNPLILHVGDCDGFPEEVLKIIDSGLDIDKICELEKLLDAHTQDEPLWDMAYQYIDPSVRDVCHMKKWLDSVTESTKNIISQIDYVLDNIKDNNVILSANVSTKENKPVINFWPLTQSYEYEIENDNVAVNEGDGLNNLKPGDIEHHRYGSRYKMTDPDK